MLNETSPKGARSPRKLSKKVLTLIGRMTVSPSQNSSPVLLGTYGYFFANISFKSNSSGICSSGFSESYKGSESPPSKFLCSSSSSSSGVIYLEEIPFTDC